MSPSNREEKVYVGIDVAFARKKRLPVSVCRIVDGRLSPMSLRNEPDKPPAGRGNQAALESSERIRYAEQVVEWLQNMTQKHSLHVEQIAIDAPSDFCAPHLTRRMSEQALDRAGISCFATPTRSQFDEKISTSKEHLRTGGKLSRLPNANQLWMLVGFAIFDVLKFEGFCCIETYPQAIVRELKCSERHKSAADGLKGQIGRVASVLGFSSNELTGRLEQMGFGSRHDRVDALLSAWVASLPSSHQKVFGDAPDDAIVVPDMELIEADAIKNSET
ncbi:hypothetical protein Mal4_56400 [Maioricimonas rarisocia]|uniref:DUF429 domain-containing protein n=1 Tax=Maioricimonas rarisocia TaxID=2528026 RepID=A0A517ZFP3_9PLAN|nr:DUF429 domain-containing protein [Maioricimonas rarisocia]QDU41274.1 hypothetical protein Mal4_56400 [Maioricimonas rarisocia]